MLDAQQTPPDIILTNGKIITVDAQFSIAQAVAIRSDRIVAVGTNPDITALAGAGTRRIDLQGRSVVPGFIDPHLHPSMAALLLPMEFTTVVEWDLPWSQIGAVGSRVELLDRDRE